MIFEECCPKLIYKGRKGEYTIYALSRVISSLKFQCFERSLSWETRQKYKILTSTGNLKRKTVPFNVSMSKTRLFQHRETTVRLRCGSANVQNSPSMSRQPLCMLSINVTTTPLHAYLKGLNLQCYDYIVLKSIANSLLSSNL